MRKIGNSSLTKRCNQGCKRQEEIVRKSCICSRYVMISGTDYTEYTDWWKNKNPWNPCNPCLKENITEAHSGKSAWRFGLVKVPFEARRHPGVEYADTRMSDMPRPGCQHIRHPGLIQLKTVTEERHNRERREWEQDFAFFFLKKVDNIPIRTHLVE